MTAKYNGHVLKWYRWQHFLAERDRRFLAMFIWAHAVNSNDYEADS